MDGGDLTRLTLRMPEALKTHVEQTAAAEGVSVNAWLVRAVTAAVQRPMGPPPSSPRQAHHRLRPGLTSVVSSPSKETVMPEFDRSTPVTVALRTHRGKVDIVAEDRVSVVADVVPLDDSDASAAGRPRTPRSHWRATPWWSVRRRRPAGSGAAAEARHHRPGADGQFHRGEDRVRRLRATGRYRIAQVTLASGDAWVDEVTGDAHLEAASGDLTVNRVGGSLRVHSASGDIEVGDVNGDVSADAASGDIVIRSAGASVKAGGIGRHRDRRGPPGSAPVSARRPATSRWACWPARVSGSTSTRRPARRRTT